MSEFPGRIESGAFAGARGPRGVRGGRALFGLVVWVWAWMGAAGVGRGAERFEWRALTPIPESLGVAGPFAGTSEGALIVAGGANFPSGPPWAGGRKVWQDRIWVLPTPEGQWREGGRLPRPLAYGVAVSSSRGVVCVGGSDADRHYADCFELVREGEGVSARELPSLPVPLAHAAGAVVGGVLYVVGGTFEPGERVASGRLFALDLRAVRAGWRELEPLPGAARFLSVAAAQEGSLWVAGGCALEAVGTEVRRVYLRELWRYRPGRGWVRRAELPVPVAGAPSPGPAVGQSHLVVAGGDDGSGVGVPAAERAGFSGRLLAYHTITDTWAELGVVPAPRATVPVVEWRGRWVIPSGEVRPGVRSPEVWAVGVTRDRVGFGGWNYATLFAYLAAMVGLGVAFTARNRTTEDFFRGGQRVPWWAAGLSIFSTILSSITFMSIPAQGYSVGWNLFLGNSHLVLTPLIVLVFLPFYRRLNVTSAYEYLERRFDGTTRRLASGLFILFQVGRAAIVLYLPALALATVSRMDVTLCILLMGVLCLVYAMLGGMEAVVWTDVAQAIVLMGGACWALAAVVLRVDGGIGTVVREASLHGRFFETVAWNLDYTVATGWVIVIGSVFNNLFTYTASQDVVQRYVTTPDRRGAVRAVLTNAVLAAPAQAVFFAIGTALFVYYRQQPARLDPTLANDGIFPHFIMTELPAGVGGLIVAGIFAAAQSTLASSLNSVATAWVTDFDRVLRPGASDGSRLRLARWLTLGVGLAATGAAVWLARSEVRSAWEVSIAVVGLFGGPVAGLFLLGIFSRRATATGALAGALAGAGSSVWVYAGRLADRWCYAVVGVVGCVVVGWLVSVVRPGRGGPPVGTTLHTLKSEAETPRS